MEKKYKIKATIKLEVTVFADCEEYAMDKVDTELRISIGDDYDNVDSMEVGKLLVEES